MVEVNSTMLPLGTQAPEFSLPDPAGVQWSLTKAAGQKGVLVTFMCNHCPFVKHIAAAFGEAADRWLSSGVGVIAINSNDTESYPDDRPEYMSPQAAQWGWNFPYVVDEDQTVAHAYHAACTPDFFLFDTDFRLVYRGRFDASTPGNNVPLTGAELDAAVNALVAGAAPVENQIPSVGCNIKWKHGNEPPWFG